MQITARAYQKFIRQTPRKLRLVADLVRGNDVDTALTTLKFTPKRAARMLETVITQAKANAMSQESASNLKSLKITDIQIEEGPRLKRWRPVSRGRAHAILKRMSHIKVIVSGETETKKPVKADASAEKTGKKK